VIVFAIIDKWKYAAISGRIAAMCVHSAIALLNPTLVTDHKVAVVMNLALGNVVSEIGFSHLVARIQMHSQVKRTVRKVSTIHPLAVNPPVVNIVTTGRNALPSFNRAVESLVKSRITLGVL